VTKSQAQYSNFNADLNRTTIILPLHSIGIWEESGKSEEKGGKVLDRKAIQFAGIEVGFR
jgi:hypothetical protein